MQLGESIRGCPRRAALSPHGGTVAQSCRVRLARNLRGERFPDWSDEAGRRRAYRQVVDVVMAHGGLEQPKAYAVEELNELDLQDLCERRVASYDLAERGPGAGVVVGGPGTLSVMINEEDHLRIQVIEPGMDLRRAWQAADALDSRLETHLDYAFSRSLGYLTACPSNAGTGLRASVMVQLLGLRLTNDLDPVLRGLDRLRLAVRGIGGEGSTAAGHMYQISNQGTLGRSEEHVIDELLAVVGEVVRQERFARLRLLRDDPALLEDCVSRALALLQHARVMQTEEALDYLSALRLGVEMGMTKRLDVARAEALAQAVQPGALQRLMGDEADPEQRDVFRADWLRKQLAEVSLTV